MSVFTCDNVTPKAIPTSLMHCLLAAVPLFWAQACNPNASLSSKIALGRVRMQVSSVAGSGTWIKSFNARAVSSVTAQTALPSQDLFPFSR